MLSALDLFAGAGGFSLGLHNAGLSVVGAIEQDRFAAETYRKNHSGTSIIEDDITNISDSKVRSSYSGVDVLFGGPPCQGFSVAGPSQYGKSDPRNHLIFQFERFAKILKPRFIVVENVKGAVNGRLGRKRGALNALSDALSDLGYFTDLITLRAADFGVPQTRERVFLIAQFDEPLVELAHSISSQRDSQELSALDAISDLPSVQSGEGIDGPVPYKTAPTNRYQIWAREGSKTVSNHVAMKHTPRIIERLKAIRPGQSLKDVGKEHGQRRRNSQEIDTTKRYKMNCYRLDPTSPAITLPANFQTIHVHPTLDRMLTAREGARLQSFPDSYVFCGPRTLMSKKLLEREGRHSEIGLSQYNQIGNAVAPKVAKALGFALQKQVLGEERIDVNELA